MDNLIIEWIKNKIEETEKKAELIGKIEGFFKGKIESVVSMLDFGADREDIIKYSKLPSDVVRNLDIVHRLYSGKIAVYVKITTLQSVLNKEEINREVNTVREKSDLIHEWFGDEIEEIMRKFKIKLKIEEKIGSFFECQARFIVNMLDLGIDNEKIVKDSKFPIYIIENLTELHKINSDRIIVSVRIATPE